MSSALAELKEKEDTPIPVAERLVEVGCTWINVFSVDSVQQTFEADISIRLTWTESDPVVMAKIEEVEAKKQKAVLGSAHGKAAMDIKDFVEQCWDPQFMFANCESMEDSEQWVRADRVENDTKMKVVWAIRFRCHRFTCKFDLHHFPFDQQALFIRISSQWDESKVQFVTSTRAEPSRQAYDDYNLSDYTISTSRIVDLHSVHCPKNAGFQCRTDPSSSNSGARYNSAFLVQNVSRNPEFFVLNLYLPAFLISSSAFIAFVFRVEDFGGRSSVLMTLLLTAVAFRQVVGQNLPRLPYITYLDRYALVSLLLIVLIGVIVGAESTAAVCVEAPSRRPTLCIEVLPSFDFRYLDHADHVCLIVVSVCWLVYQICEGAVIGYNRRVEQSEENRARERRAHLQESKAAS